MKLRILSDLHLEFQGLQLTPGTEDIVLLAGDIDVGGRRDQGIRGVKWALETFPETTPVLYVAGNHEHYGGRLRRTMQKMKEAAAGTHVHILDNDTFEWGDVRFFGGTLWSDYRGMGNHQLSAWDAQTRMEDFKQIRVGPSFARLKPHHLEAEHARTCLALSALLDTPTDKKTVVITHHAPHINSVHPRHLAKDKYLCAAYFSDLSRFMGRGIDLMVHGHTHDSCFYVENGTPVVSNPRGYGPNELNEDFDPNFVAEV